MRHWKETSAADKLKMLGLVIGAVIMIVVTVLAARWVMTLRDPDKLAAFQELVRSLGWGGWLLLLAIQYVQIVVAFIPGGPIQIVAGALFGPLGGLATCLLGTVLATATVFSLVSKFGHSIISLFVDKKDIANYKFLNDEKRAEFLVLLLFFIPGTPKDALTYLFALTPIALGRFMLLSTVARIPAMLTSVLAGNSIVNGQWLRALIYFSVTTLISLGGLLLHRKIMQRYHKHHP